MDDQQRAREFLAAEYERSGLHQSARDIRTNRMDEHLGWVRETNMAISAITTALRAAPEAVALRVAMETLVQIASTPRNKGARMNAKATLLFLQTQAAARPQGVKD